MVISVKVRLNCGTCKSPSVLTIASFATVVRWWVHGELLCGCTAIMFSPVAYIIPVNILLLKSNNMLMCALLAQAS